MTNTLIHHAFYVFFFHGTWIEVTGSDDVFSTETHGLVKPIGIFLNFIRISCRNFFVDEFAPCQELHVRMQYTVFFFVDETLKVNQTLSMDILKTMRQFYLVYLTNFIS